MTVTCERYQPLTRDIGLDTIRKRSAMLQILGG